MAGHISIWQDFFLNGETLCRTSPARKWLLLKNQSNLGHGNSMVQGISEPIAHGQSPEKKLGAEKPKAAAMKPVILLSGVPEETNRLQRSRVGLFPYNSEKLGDSMIDRP
jgi:hypothetical protein